jgi:hypothetical protein
MSVAKRRRSAPTKYNDSEGLVRGLLEMIQQHKPEPRKLLVYTLGCVVANAIQPDDSDVTDEQAFADIGEVAVAARLVIETAQPLNMLEPKTKAKPIATDEAREVYAQAVRAAVGEAIAKVGGGDLGSVASVNYFAACGALADMIGALMASDPDLPDNDIKDAATHLLVNRAAGFAQRLRDKGLTLDAGPGFQQ